MINILNMVIITYFSVFTRTDIYSKAQLSDLLLYIYMIMIMIYV